MIERKIIISLITQTEYLRQIKSEWNYDFIESHTARMISGWCWEYFDKYLKAPMQDIEIIYIEKLKKGLDKKLAKEIEEDILPGLSEEYERGEINIVYILEQTRSYFMERTVALHIERLRVLHDKNNIKEAISEAQNFKIITEREHDEIDLSLPEVLQKIDSAFDTVYQSVITFPGALGNFWNEQFVRGSFIGILAPEKRGKTFLLIELMMRAYLQKKRVAIFQAGDMTENQLLMRICTYLTKRPHSEKYLGLRYVPVQDCIKNQTDTCTKEIRECDFGIFNEDETELRKTITFEKLIEAYKDNSKYKPCYNCLEWEKCKLGTVWVKRIDVKQTLTQKVAKKAIYKFFISTGRHIKVSTHVNGSLKVSEIKSILKKWKVEEDFIPDLILIDYADLLIPEIHGEFRHQQNDIWKKLRGMSQEYDCCVVTPTQSDSDSYSQDRLGLKNFNEDKRKYGHVTAMYGLNHDVSGREKKIGLMRINKIVVREDEFHFTDEVTILQRLELGKPFLGSYY
ncbi:MAG: hypothetical protein WC389_19690 [Lutibacter sp.]|jgi:hypothetical protein